jgi:uncharacterized protein YjbI with pentapeptide repeats
MARKKSAPDWPAPRFPNRTFALASNLQTEGVKKFIEEEGGQVVSAVSASLDYLITGYPQGNRKTPEEKQARELNKKGAAIHVLSEQQFYTLLLPDREEALLLLEAGEKGRQRWQALWNTWNFVRTKMDFSGLDLRGKNLSRCQLQTLILDGADLRNANLSGCALPELKEVKLDGAHLPWASFSRASGCSFTKADASQAHINPAVFTGCDFTGAVLHKLGGMFSQITDCVFRKVDLREAGLERSQLRQTDFTEANLSGAELGQCVFDGVRFRGTKLVGAKLAGTRFVKADLSNADLRGAFLMGADLSGAVIDGANFEGANLADANLAGLDLAKARGLDPAAMTGKGKAGPQIAALEQVVRQSQRVSLVVTATLPSGGYVILQVDASKYGVAGYHTVYREKSSDGRPGDGSTIPACMLHLANLYWRGTLQFDSVEVKAKNCPMGGRDLKKLALAAWCEAFGIETSTPDAVEQQRQEVDTLREEMLAELRSGPTGVGKWNRRESADRKRAGAFRRVDLSAAKLDGADLEGLDLEGATFEKASLRKATLGQRGNFRKVNFRGADLREAGCVIAPFSGSDFTAAVMKKALLCVSTFSSCLFREADLEGADFGHSDVRGADFSGANLAGIRWEQTKYDERTRWPNGFQPPEGLVWRGKGPDPRIAQAIRSLPASGPLDFPTFLERLRENTDSARLARAFAMLKADRFQLFADVKSDSLVGVVKSQTDRELVYSCRLAADGTFACCTQNLKPCGGLGGALCKHLLVLIVGLTRSGALDPAAVDRWVQASRLRKPELDREAMSDVFLKYKGAEAGEVDWRPTETLPEDYYAL